MKWKKIITITVLIFCMAFGMNLVYGRAYAVQGNDSNETGDSETEQGKDDSGKTMQSAKDPSNDSVGEPDRDKSDSGTAGQDKTSLVIDNQNLYDGMKKPYSKGYVPSVQKKRAVIIIPLLAECKLKGNRIKTALNLGETENSPFIHKNYEKDVPLKRHKVGKEGKETECYLVTYELNLKKDRYNGSYPVVVHVTAEDEAGNEINQDFTIYVTITDGKSLSGISGTGDMGGTPDTGSTGGETIQFAPKVMVDSYQFSKKAIQSGDDFTVDITLVNTSKTNVVKNMLVTASPGENIELLSKSDSAYVEELGTGKTCVVSYRLKANVAAPQGQYSVTLAMDYADGKGNPYTAQGNVKITVGQLVKIGIDPIVLPAEIQMGETVELQIQVMNLGRGKLYNVRAVAEADGLESSGTAFIGDIEAGNAVSGSTEITAVGLSGNSLYGKTNGKVTFYYEDEAGTEMSEEMTFETSIMSPLNEKKKRETEDNSGQWWVIMAVIVAILVVAIVLFIVRRTTRIQTGTEELDENK